MYSSDYLLLTHELYFILGVVETWILRLSKIDVSIGIGNNSPTRKATPVGKYEILVS